MSGVNNMFVLIDTKNLTYVRYSGRTRLQKVNAEEPLDAYWVEVLRLRPEEIIPPEEPQLA